MKKLLTLGLSLLSGLILISAWKAPASITWTEKVAPDLLEKALELEQVDFMLFLQQQADISGAKALNTKEEKAWFTFQKLQETAKNSQAEIIALLESRGLSFRPFYITNTIQIIGDIDLIKELAERPEVARMTSNPRAMIQSLPQGEQTQASTRAAEWGIKQINADDAWDMGFRGQGVVIGGSDTGVEWFHPAIVNRYRGTAINGSADHNYNWHDAIHEIDPLHEDPIVLPSNNPCGLDSDIPCDDNDHGTHTIGTAVGDDESVNQIGVAPKATWIACRSLERGYGSLATYLECFEWFLAPTDLNDENPNPGKAPHVINNSWSCPEMEGCTIDNWAALDEAINALRTSGVFVVASAGNKGSQGCSSIFTPAAIFENSFTVGSSDRMDDLSSFSSRGPVSVDGSGRVKPNVVAPGSMVRSSIKDGEYEEYSGTSAAGPHVAGLVALLISADPSLAGKVDELEDIIEKTAIPRGNDEACGSESELVIPNSLYGFGRVDALAAINFALQSSSVNNFNNQSLIRIFPNPVTEIVQFEIQNTPGDVQIDIFNASGQLLHSQNALISNTYQIESASLGGLAKGIYFYRITGEQASFAGKLVKK